METLDRKVYTMRLLVTYIISPVISYLIAILVIVILGLLGLLSPPELGNGDGYQLMAAAFTSIIFAGVVEILILLISVIVCYILVTIVSIKLATKRLNDAKINKIWRVFVIIPIVGQIISFLLIFPRSKTTENTTH